MAFWRIRSNGISLIHGQRTSNGVRQKVLHTFKDASELKAVLEERDWLAFRLMMEQKHPKVAPNWEGVRQKALQIWSERGAQQSETSQWERQKKFRKALRWVSRELYRLRDPELTMAAGRELIDCLSPGLQILFRNQGMDRESARLLANETVPDGEATDYLVDRARAAFSTSPARGQKGFAEARRYDPFDPDVLNSEGICWYDRGKYDQALTCFERAREMAHLQLPNPDKVYSWGQLEVRPYMRAIFNLGLVHLQKENFASALQLFQECLQRCPDSAMDAEHMLGSTCHRMGQLEQALKHYQQCRDSLAPDANFDLALVLFQLNRLDEAVLPILEGLSVNHWMAEVLLQKPRALSHSLCGVDSYDWAARYSLGRRKYWSTQARGFLKRVTQDLEVQRILQKLMQIDEQLEDLRSGSERSELVSRLFALRAQLANKDLALRVAARLESSGAKSRGR